MQPPAREQRGKAVTITALILAGIALILCWIPIVNNAVFFLGLIGVVLAVFALLITLRGRSTMRGMAVASLVVGRSSLVGVLAAEALYASVPAGASDATEGFPEGKISDPDVHQRPGAGWHHAPGDDVACAGGACGRGAGAHTHRGRSG